MAIKAAIIGCGARGPAFTEACLAAGDVEMVGFMDIVKESADNLVNDFGGKAFTDISQMIGETKPDFICMVTRPNVRLDPIRQCAEAGVKAMLSEKPMSTSWGEAVAIHSAAEQAGMKLSFCHQRRCLPQYVKAKQLIDNGAIGELKQIIGHCDDMYDWGTHWYDMMHHLNGEVEADWLIANADRETVKYVFAQPMDKCGIATIHFTNDVIGTLQSGAAAAEKSRVRVIGDQGTLIVADDWAMEEKLVLINGDGIQQPELDDAPSRPIDVGVAETINALREDRESVLSSAHALRATQLVFGAYQSGITGKRIDLPLREDFDLSLINIFGEAPAKKK